MLTIPLARFCLGQISTDYLATCYVVYWQEDDWIRHFGNRLAEDRIDNVGLDPVQQFTSSSGLISYPPHPERIRFSAVHRSPEISRGESGIDTVVVGRTYSIRSLNGFGRRVEITGETTYRGRYELPLGNRNHLWIGFLWRVFSCQRTATRFFYCLVYSFALPI